MAAGGGGGGWEAYFHIICFPAVVLSLGLVISSGEMCANSACAKTRQDQFSREGGGAGRRRFYLSVFYPSVLLYNEGNKGGEDIGSLGPLDGGNKVVFPPGLPTLYI